LKALEMAVNVTEAMMLAFSSGVWRNQCITSSKEWFAKGSSTITVVVAAHRGVACRKACVRAPQNPESTARSASSASIAPRAACKPAPRLTKKNIAPRRSELSNADFQFHCRPIR
jgi:hypothetical protein